MFQIVYLSFSTKEWTKDEMIELLDNSRKNNQTKGITGILLYRSGIFLQLLEGPKEKVMSLYHKIEKDQRHQHIKPLIKIEEGTQIFSEWSMAFKELNEMDIRTINMILPWESITSNNKQFNNEDILELLKTFRWQKKDAA